MESPGGGLGRVGDKLGDGVEGEEGVKATYARLLVCAMRWGLATKLGAVWEGRGKG